MQNADHIHACMATVGLSGLEAQLVPWPLPKQVEPHWTVRLLAAAGMQLLPALASQALLTPHRVAHRTLSKALLCCSEVSPVRDLLADHELLEKLLQSRKLLLHSWVTQRDSWCRDVAS